MTEGQRTIRTRSDLYDGFALMGKALAAGRRLEILDLLSQGPRSVRHLADELGQSVANTSQHLQVLADAGLVCCARSNHHMIYQLRSPAVAELLVSLCDLAAETIGDVFRLTQAHVGSRQDIPSITRRGLMRRIRMGDVVVIDVRPEHDFAAGHIAGAISVTQEKIEEFARSLDTRSEVIAYCRGEYCSLADSAIRTLQGLGIRARRLEGGYPQWVTQGGNHQKIA